MVQITGLKVDFSTKYVYFNVNGTELIVQWNQDQDNFGTILIEGRTYDIQMGIGSGYVFFVSLQESLPNEFRHGHVPNLNTIYKSEIKIQFTDAWELGAWKAPDGITSFVITYGLMVEYMRGVSGFDYFRLKVGGITDALVHISQFAYEFEFKHKGRLWDGEYDEEVFEFLKDKIQTYEG